MDESCGKEVAARIKKIGPIELLEGQKAARELDSIAGEGARALGRSGVIKRADSFKLDLTKVELTASEEFYYLEGDKLLTHLKLLGAEPETGADRDVVMELLLSKQGDLDYQGYFWLAYAQDELAQWYEAVRSNLETLKRRPRLAPARYNLALSLLKLGKYESAYRHLGKISAADEKLSTVASGVPLDEEMKNQVAAVPDAAVRQRLLAELSRISSLAPK